MSVPNLWRTKKQRYSLRGNVCTECSNVMFPPRGVCPYCSADQDADRDADRDAYGAQPARDRNPFTISFGVPEAAEPMVAAAGDD